MWTPILDDRSEREARSAVEDLARQIPVEVSAADVEPSLGGGALGRLLFHECHARVRADGPIPRTLAASWESLRNRLSVATVSDRCRLYPDLLGIAWARAHVDSDVTEPDLEDPLDALDEDLPSQVRFHEERGEFDVIRGLVGVGVYALERFPLPAARACLELLVGALRRTAVETDHGVAWRSRAPEGSWQKKFSGDRPYLDLGVAHGVPGVIAFLAEVCAAGVAVRESSALLESAVSWLLAQRLPRASGPSFPSLLVEGVDPRPTSAAWCYGDIGIAGALLHAARCVGEGGWERQALEIARGLLPMAPEEAGMHDACLCHGAAGIAHVYNRIFQATRGEEFLAGARRWFRYTLDMRRPGEGLGGFLTATVDEAGNPALAEQDGFLVGASGTGLALLAAFSDVEPRWDRVLMLSGPSGAPMSTPKGRWERIGEPARGRS